MYRFIIYHVYEFILIMYAFNLTNAYALKFFFNNHERLSEEEFIVFYINNKNCNYEINIAHNSIIYVVQVDDIRYQIIFEYTKKHVQKISIYGYLYSVEEDFWIETYDPYLFAYFDEFYIKVLLQVQQNFYTIESNCDAIPHDFHWIYHRVKLFEQRCTPKTAKYLQLFRKKLKLKQYFRKWNKFIHQKLLKRKFIIWKDWYYDPTNKHGYVKRLINRYEEFM